MVSMGKTLNVTKKNCVFDNPPGECQRIISHPKNAWDLPSGKLTQLWNMTIEIVDFPSYNMVIFHSYVSHYERVQP